MCALLIGHTSNLARLATPGRVIFENDNQATWGERTMREGFYSITFVGTTGDFDMAAAMSFLYARVKQQEVE